jgi:apolipoprotein N-acyltransferase
VSAKAWATTSLVAAGLWLLLSLAPTPITTLIGAPFLLAALLTGTWSWRAGQQANDLAVKRRAGWGLGLSCAGCLWQVIALAVFGGVSAALLYGLVQSLQGTSTP